MENHHMQWRGLNHGDEVVQELTEHVVRDHGVEASPLIGQCHRDAAAISQQQLLGSRWRRVRLVVDST
jgi:hypothetical protein